MPIKPLPPLTQLREWFLYDAETGALTWRQSNGRRAVVGMSAGYRRPNNGYIYVELERRSLAAHRVAWALHHNDDPYPHEIDHRDGDKANNRPDNLRLSTSTYNAANRGVRSDSASRLKGVSWRAEMQMYRVNISANGKRYHLGHYKTIEEARAAYNAAALILHGQFAKLNP